MKRVTLLLTFFFVTGLLFADLDADTAPVTVPVFYPYSDAFFASRFQSASMALQLPNFFFFDAIGDLLYIPGFAEVKHNDSSDKSVVRMAGAIGGKIAINDYFTGMAGLSFVGDSIYIANSYNLFATAGLFAHYTVLGFDFGIGVFGGYYWNDFRQLPEKKDEPGIYEGILDSQSPVTTQAARFIFTPRIGMSDTEFFLESLGGSFNVTEDLSTGGILGDIAFKTIQAWLIRLNIDLYYKSNWYNLYMKDRLFGANFATKYLSIEVGYRWFDPVSEISFLSNYQDGLYGKAIVKFPAMGVNILLSYSFETTFETMHYFGIGVTLPVDGWRNDYLYEFAGNYLQNMHFSASNLTGW
ncbi:MAG: hypothetical protein LBI40_03945 [Treponema sp.]|jgi:hypothetical protein|nr:hypothetical protein [Treponema sp.]